MNLRRQTMGITGTTAEVQGANIGAQTFTTKETNQQIQERIEKGRRGVGTQKYIQLLGIFQDSETRRSIFDRTAKDAFTTPQIQRMIIEKLGELPDDQSSWILAKQRGFHILGESEYMRLTGPQGPKARELTIEALKKQPPELPEDVQERQTKLGQAVDLVIATFKTQTSKWLDESGIVTKLTAFANATAKSIASINSWSDINREIGKFATWIAGDQVNKGWESLVKKIENFGKDSVWDSITARWVSLLIC
jgi:hypothetical protein